MRRLNANPIKKLLECQQSNHTLLREKPAYALLLRYLQHLPFLGYNRTWVT